MASWIWRYYELKPERYCCWVIISVKIRTQCGNLGCVFLIWILLPPTPLFNNDVFWKACVWLPYCLGIRTKCISFGSYHSARQCGLWSKKVQKCLFTLKYRNSFATVMAATMLGFKENRYGCTKLPISEKASSQFWCAVLWSFVTLSGHRPACSSLWETRILLPYTPQHKLILPKTTVPRVGRSHCIRLCTNT